MVYINNYLLWNYGFEGGKRMICPKCGGDTFIMVSDLGLKCENCGYIYSIDGKKWNMSNANLKTKTQTSVHIFPKQLMQVIPNLTRIGI